MTSITRVAFIGFGNMAKAVVDGAVNAGTLLKNNIIVSSPGLCNGTKTAGYEIAKNNPDAAKKADIIILGVKPNMIETVCGEIADSLLEKNTSPLIISIAAGVTTGTIQKYLRNETLPIVRIMPNIAIAVGLGASGFYATPLVTTGQTLQIKSILESTGILVTVDDEDDLDKITAISGSGPAYFLLIQELLTSAAMNLGLRHDVANTLVAQTMLGTSVLTRNSTLDFRALREQVTSKGGTTAAGVNCFIDGGIERLINEAVNAAYKRAIELRQLPP